MFSKIDYKMITFLKLKRRLEIRSTKKRIPENVSHETFRNPFSVSLIET